jgi:small subunit ribosomal protein S17
MESTTKARRTTKIGVVVSDAMDKTVVVRVNNLVKHTLYHRFVKRSRNFVAHDEGNTCKVGDRVQITECRPLSKSKKFRVVRVIERAS